MMDLGRLTDYIKIKPSPACSEHGSMYSCVMLRLICNLSQQNVVSVLTNMVAGRTWAQTSSIVSILQYNEESSLFLMPLPPLLQVL